MFDCLSFRLTDHPAANICVTSLRDKMRLIPSNAVLVLCTILNIACDSCDDDETLVQIEHGLIRGKKLKTVVGGYEYFSYKGIPYAKPPTGTRRFKAPEEPCSWDGVLNCTEHGSVCPQYNPISGVYTPGSENCLSLNVYSPNINPETKFPVMVFVHGGAYMFGCGNSSLYGPDYILEKKVVTVSFNYRLHALGFMCIGNKDVPGNAGLKDQVLAFKWVQKNIANFGGDPNSVTIVGDTAGGQSVTLHMLSPMSKGLFQRAVSMSGAPSCDFGLTYKPERRAQILGELCNCSDVKNSTALQTCLQEADYHCFFNFSPTVMLSEQVTLFKSEDFTPVIERNTGNNFFTDEYFEILSNGCVNNEVDFMMGYAGKEAVLLIDYYVPLIKKFKRFPELFVPSEILMKCTPDTIMEVADRVMKYYFGDKEVTVEKLYSFLNYSSEASIGYHAQRFANKWAPLGNKTYFFKFEAFTNWNYIGQQGIPYGITEAAHMDWPYYIFHPLSLNWTVDTNSSEYQLSQQMVTALTNFVKTGNPNIDDIEWPEYDTTDKAFMTFGDDGPTLGYCPDEDSYTFWKGIFEYAKVPF